MTKIKPTIPSGTRDFSPEQVAKRNFIFNTIRNVFEKYGFQPIETPAMENLSTLTGKYGEEGDKLIYKILNSGDFLKDASFENIGLDIESIIPFFEDWKIKHPLETMPLRKLVTANMISEKALRYDLTVPFARYVVQHQNEITFPFKRYQIQPVWRADRPQRGRYREFWQCDADVIGSDSLLNEVELIQIYDEVFSKLGFEDYTIRVNNRKILEGIVEEIGAQNKISEIIILIDKIEKIGVIKVIEELRTVNVSEQSLEKLKNILLLNEDLNYNRDNFEILAEWFTWEDEQNEIGIKGLNEIKFIYETLKSFNKSSNVKLDISLARGLSYYTGTIIEVKINNIQIGSVGGGGRYDDLTGMFGLPNVSGVGISFGVDRIYDAMEEIEKNSDKKLFSENIGTFTKILFVNFDFDSEKFVLPLLQKFRAAGIKSEIYPSSEKLKKQMKYADDKKIPFVVLVGSEEIQTGKLTLKNMSTGEQEKISIDELIAKLLNS